MSRTQYGFVIVDKTSLEAGVLVIMHYLPLKEPPTPKAAQEYLETLTKDPQFAKLVKDTESTPFVMPTLGLLCDLFDELIAGQEDPVSIAPAIAQPPKSKIIMPGDINKPYESQLPMGAEAIIRSLQQNGQQVII